MVDYSQAPRDIVRSGGSCSRSRRTCRQRRRIRICTTTGAGGRSPAPSFWGTVAFLLFFFVLGLLTLLVPWLLARDIGEPSYPRRLPVRLSSADGARDLAVGAFSLGVLFAAPVYPLGMLALGLRHSDVQGWAVGGCLACTAIGGFMLLIGVMQLYKRLVKGEAVVELMVERLHPGQGVPLFITYEPGWLQPQRLRVNLLCRETTRHRKRGDSGASTYDYTQRVQHTAILYEHGFEDGAYGTWEHSLTLTLPDDAQPTTNPGDYPAIFWDIVLEISAPRAPDFALRFPFQIVAEV